MIEKELEIMIITYNRSADLENTLKQLIKSPFAKCKITVLDNCSNDNTPNICIKYQKIFSNMQIIKHEKNMGGGPNYLRAVELSKSLYTWVLCDDDNYNFCDCLDIIRALKSESFDLVIVTSHFQFGWERGLRTTSTELIKRGSRYYHTLSFIPSIIFKTKLFNSECVIKGYGNVNNLYPHFEFINTSVNENFSIYVSKNEIVKPGGHNPANFSFLMWIISWMNSCSAIKDKKIRKNAIYSLSDNDPFVKTILNNIISEKCKAEKPYKNIFSLVLAFITAFEFDKIQLLLLLIIPLALVPSHPFKIASKYKNRKIKLYEESLNYDHFRR